MWNIINLSWNSWQFLLTTLPLCEKCLSLLYKLILYQCIRGSALLYCSFSSFNGFSWSFQLLLPLWSCFSSNTVITQSLCKSKWFEFWRVVPRLIFQLPEWWMWVVGSWVRAGGMQVLTPLREAGARGCLAVPGKARPCRTSWQEFTEQDWRQVILPGGRQSSDESLKMGINLQGRFSSSLTL